MHLHQVPVHVRLNKVWKANFDADSKPQMAIMELKSNHT